MRTGTRSEPANIWPMRLRSRLALVSAAAAGAVVFLLSAVLVGSAVPVVRALPPLGTPARVGIGGGLTGIAPLTQRFVDSVLGEAPSHALSRAPAEVIGPGVATIPEELGEVVEHALTNDDRANAYAIGRIPFTASSTTTGAGREQGEPSCGTQLGGTVWYRYRPVRDEVLVADTFGTRYQTTLAAYRARGGGVEELEHACDSDAQGNAQIVFEAERGVVYLFQVGASVRGGDLRFHLRPFGATLLASITSREEASDGASTEASVSGDGRFVAFTSTAGNLAPEVGSQQCQPLRRGTGVFTKCLHIYVRDRVSGTTTLVSVTPAGRPANGHSRQAQISDDGRYVVFASLADDIVPGDGNGIWDVFIRDLTTRVTERVSVGLGGADSLGGPLDTEPYRSMVSGAGGSQLPAVSADGRFVAFESSAGNLVQGDTNEEADVFVRDRLTGTTSLVSLDQHGRQAPASFAATLDSISRDGRYVVFNQRYPMTDDDRDQVRDVFVRDMVADTIELVSVAAEDAGSAGDRNTWVSSLPSQRSISDDGRFIVFGSDDALVAGDTNGVTDVFVRDRARGVTERVSVSSTGAQGVGTNAQAGPAVGAGDVLDWAISGDGRRVVFSTPLNLLEPNDTDNGTDVFVHDRATRTTIRVSISQTERSGGYQPRISADGLWIVFGSGAPLTEEDANGTEDIWIQSPLASTKQGAGRPRGCTPGIDGCVPTPHQCAAGGYTGAWLGGSTWIGAACGGAGGTSLLYIGGNPTVVCGAIVVADQPIASSVNDPNDCPRSGPVPAQPPDVMLPPGGLP